jgi:hypothetical protein
MTFDCFAHDLPPDRTASAIISLPMAWLHGRRRKPAQLHHVRHTSEIALTPN